MRSERALPDSPRVLAVIGSKSACEVYRIFNPFLHLRALGYTCDWVQAERLARVDVAPYDVIVTPRLGLDTQAERDGFYADMHSLGKTVVYEIDDDLINMPPTNPAAFAPDQTESVRDMIARADLVTVSTNHLANRLRALNPDVVTLPNCVDPDLWSFPKARIRQIEGLTIGVHGGQSHYADWALLPEVFRELHRRYPEVKFVIAGYHPDYLLDLAPELGDRLVLLDWVPVEYYPVLVAQIDIGLCPLIDDEFNRSKSPIKWQESAMVGAPCVCSPTVYGRVVNHGTTGFLARDPAEWVACISRLIERPALRRAVGAAARGFVLRQLNIHESATRWMSAYRQAWQRVTRKGHRTRATGVLA